MTNEILRIVTCSGANIKHCKRADNRQLKQAVAVEGTAVTSSYLVEISESQRKHSEFHHSQ